LGHQLINGHGHQRKLEPWPKAKRFFRGLAINFTGSTGRLILIEFMREIAAAYFGLGFTPPRGVDETAAGEISSAAR
jgi:hypothetical protein